MEDRGHRVAERQCGELFAPAIEECIGSDHERAGSQLDQGREDRIEVAFGAGMQEWSCSPRVRAAACRSLARISAEGLAGLTRSAMMVAAGTNSCSSSSRFGPSSTFNGVTPVTLPPGRLRLATSQPRPDRSLSGRRWESSRSPPLPRVPQA